MQKSQKFKKNSWYLTNTTKCTKYTQTHRQPYTKLNKHHTAQTNTQTHTFKYAKTHINKLKIYAQKYIHRQMLKDYEIYGETYAH